jgi:hypothetical protein
MAVSRVDGCTVLLSIKTAAKKDLIDRISLRRHVQGIVWSTRSLFSGMGDCMYKVSQGSWCTKTHCPTPARQEIRQQCRIRRSLDTWIYRHKMKTHNQGHHSRVNHKTETNSYRGEKREEGRTEVGGSWTNVVVTIGDWPRP